MAEKEYCGNHKPWKCVLITILLMVIIILPICYMWILCNLFIILAKIIFLILVVFTIVFVRHCIIEEKSSGDETSPSRNNCGDLAPDELIKKKSRKSESYIFVWGSCLIKILKCPSTIIKYLLRGGDKFLFPIEDGCGNLERELPEKESKIPWVLEREFKCRELELPKNAKVWATKRGEWKISAENSPYIIEKEGARLKICRENYFFVDTLVLVHLVLAIGIFALLSSYASLLEYRILGVVFIALGIYRVYEYLVYQTHAVLFALEEAKRNAGVTRREENTPIILNPYRILILSILGYVNVIIWFAVFYLYIERAFNAFNEPLDWLSSLNYSFVTMTGFGETNIFLADHYGIISLIQSALGLFFIILIIAQLVSSLPKPRYYD